MIADNYPILSRVFPHQTQIIASTKDESKSAAALIDTVNRCFICSQ